MKSQDDYILHGDDQTNEFDGTEIFSKFCDVIGAFLNENNDPSLPSDVLPRILAMSVFTLTEACGIPRDVMVDVMDQIYDISEKRKMN